MLLSPASDASTIRLCPTMIGSDPISIISTQASSSSIAMWPLSCGGSGIGAASSVGRDGRTFADWSGMEALLMFELDGYPSNLNGGDCVVGGSWAIGSIPILFMSICINSWLLFASARIHSMFALCIWALA